MTGLAWCAAAAFGGMLWAVIALAKSVGKKTARLDALQAAAERTEKEQERKNAIQDGVNHLPIADVRRRLQNLSGK